MTVFTLFGGICGNSFGMVQAQTLQEYAEEMDSPLEIQQMAGAWSRAANTEPEVTIGKTAKWLDIERGYAQIDLTEEDTSVYSNQGIDYLIILDRVHNTDTFEIQVEMTSELFSDTHKDISARQKLLVDELRSALGISPKVTIVAPHSIERSTGKAVRVIDKRKLIN